MNSPAITKAAQEIAAHASNPPPEKGKQRVHYELSPHFERFTVEVIRGLLIRNTQLAEQLTAKELIDFRQFLPEALHGQFDLTCAKINEFLHAIYK